MKRKKVNTSKVGDLLRKEREKKGMLLREIAALFEMDMGLLSKIERGNRLPTREQLSLFCQYFKEEKEALHIAWLSDKIVLELAEEDYKFEAMIVAEEKMRYN